MYFKKILEKQSFVFQQHILLRRSVFENLLYFLSKEKLIIMFQNVQNC